MEMDEMQLLEQNNLNENTVGPLEINAPPEDHKNNEEGSLVVMNPTLDVETYADNYSSLAKLHRLIYIADHCPSLRLEALKTSISYVMTTYNVDLYQYLHQKLAKVIAIPLLPDISAPTTFQDIPAIDEIWIKNTLEKATLEFGKLNNSLHKYKSNSFRERVRLTYSDLGDYYIDCGDLCNAQMNYFMASKYCTYGEQTVQAYLNAIKVSIYLKDWTQALDFVSEVASKLNCLDWTSFNAKQIVLTKLHCAAGLAKLATKNYRSAAVHFVQVNLEYCNFPELLSSNNIAVYGGLCALATFNRDELQRNVILSSSFKLFLELEPQLRDIIFSFCKSQYALCLKLVEEMKDNLLLDMYIAPHINILFTQIRNQGFIQYFSCFLLVDMEKMAATFNMTMTALQEELEPLIQNGQIQAGIDPCQKILYPNNIGQLLKESEECLQIEKDYQQRVQKLLLLAEIMQKNMSLITVLHNTKK